MFCFVAAVAWNQIHLKLQNVRTKHSFEPCQTVRHMADPMMGQLICKEESDKPRNKNILRLLFTVLRFFVLRGSLNYNNDEEQPRMELSSRSITFTIYFFIASAIPVNCRNAAETFNYTSSRSFRKFLCSRRVQPMTLTHDSFASLLSFADVLERFTKFSRVVVILLP